MDSSLQQLSVRWQLSKIREPNQTPNIIEQFRLTLMSKQTQLWLQYLLITAEPEISEQSGFIFYWLVIGLMKLGFSVANEDVWATQVTLAEVFGTTKQRV